MFITGTTLEEKKSEMTERRDFIIECINNEIEGENISLKSVMVQFAQIVSASNYKAMDISIQDTVFMAADDVRRMADNGAEINATNDERERQAVRRQLIAL